MGKAIWCIHLHWLGHEDAAPYVCQYTVLTWRTRLESGKHKQKVLEQNSLRSLNLDRISEQCRLFRTQTGLDLVSTTAILYPAAAALVCDPCGFVLAVIAARQAHLNRASDQDASHKARLKLEGNQQLQEETQGQGINQSGSVKTSFMSIMSPSIAISISQNTLNKFGGKLLCCRTRDQSKLSRSLVLSCLTRMELWFRIGLFCLLCWIYFNLCSEEVIITWLCLLGSMKLNN